MLEVGTAYFVSMIYSRSGEYLHLYVDGILVAQRSTVPNPGAARFTSGQIGCWKGGRLLQGSLSNFNIVSSEVVPQAPTLAGEYDVWYQGSQGIGAVMQIRCDSS